MNTVVAGSFVKTIKAEKEIFICVAQIQSGGQVVNKRVIVDVTIFTEIIERKQDGSVLRKFFEVAVCVKDPTARDPHQIVLGCQITKPTTALTFNPQLAAPEKLFSTSHSLSLQRVGLTRTSGDRVEFWAEGSGIATTQVQVFDQTGRILFAQELPSNRVRWNARDLNGRRLANGVYFYVVGVRGADDRVQRSKVMKMVITR
jgi:hypothetical protein